MGHWDQLSSVFQYDGIPINQNYMTFITLEFPIHQNTNTLEFLIHWNSNTSQILLIIIQFHLNSYMSEFQYI